MDENGDGIQRAQVREYLRSKTFRFSSWSIGALLAASFLAPRHRVWFLFAAMAVWFPAVLPLLRVVPFKHKLDFRQRRDRWYLVFVVLYVSAGIAGAVLYSIYAAGH